MEYLYQDIKNLMEKREQEIQRLRQLEIDVSLAEKLTEEEVIQYLKPKVTEWQGSNKPKLIADLQNEMGLLLTFLDTVNKIWKEE